MRRCFVALVSLSLVLFATTVGAGQKKRMIVTAGSSSRQVNSHQWSYTSPGQSSTSCNSNAQVNGTATDEGPGTTDVVGTVNSNTNCDTTYVPPRTTNGNWVTVDNASWVTDVATGDEYLIQCTAHWLGSKCSYLTDGRYEAELKGNSMWITGMKGMKKETAKYSVLQYVQGNNMRQSSKGNTAASQQQTTQWTGDEVTAWQIYQRLQPDDQSYVQDFCKQSPGATVLVPKDKPAHVIDCKSWAAAYRKATVSR